LTEDCILALMVDLAAVGEDHCFASADSDARSIAGINRLNRGVNELAGDARRHQELLTVQQI